MKKLLSTALLMVGCAKALKLALINDIHLNLTYDQGCGIICYDRGNYGLDTPALLFDTVLENI
jgi:hypothetical protein